MKRVIVLLLAVLLILIVAGGAVAFWVFRSVTGPVAHDKAETWVKIDRGSTPPQIVAKLASEGIIASESAANIYLRLFGDASKLQAGEYQFHSPISATQVFKLLEKGEDRAIRLTIPEGFTRFDIAKRIVETFKDAVPAPRDGFTDNIRPEAQVLELMNDTSLIKDISPAAQNLEGYMYPTTYNLPRDIKARDIIKTMVDQFRKFWKPEWSAQAKAIGRTPHEIVTIASLVETETSVENERPVVAGVINNRLAKNIPLGIDQTNVYIAKMMGRWDGTIHKSDLEVDSPYNTRIKGGLPPGPISSVTESSIRAALNPQAHDYIFYVLNVDANDGSHWFYASAAEFEKGKAKYQQWLQKERQEKRANEANTTQ